jgi:hypothetical protein
MTGVLLAGCLLIAYGPSAVVLLAYASRRSALLILTIARCVRHAACGARARAAGNLASAESRCPFLVQPPLTAAPSLLASTPAASPRPPPCSAFFWLLSIFLTSIVWIAIPPLKVRATRRPRSQSAPPLVAACSLAPAPQPTSPGRCRRCTPSRKSSPSSSRRPRAERSCTSTSSELQPGRRRGAGRCRPSCARSAASASSTACRPITRCPLHAPGPNLPRTLQVREGRGPAGAPRRAQDLQ